ncbi:transforming growth factor beta receptor type 3-like [Protopterus annectens]|uniref:transforming growth factor beta receptor type 3-like n=1 Tax=Protopterus annectens TaxID=7888 RepID=UPI001CFB734A|nr:transforming growth factor beta receptor type 3-like [Protopterus annectens]
MSKRAECHVLIFFLLALIQGKEDSFYPGWCHMSPATQQHPVQGVLEVYQTGKGCNSHGTAALPHEVHIINLKETAMHQNLPEVTLHLKPVSSSQSIQHKLAVFILNSQNPVVWKLNVEQPSSSMQHIFHVSLLVVHTRNKCGTST